MAVWFSPPAGLEAYASNLDISSVTDAQFGVIRSFLLRVHELTPEARVAMAYRLAAPVAEAMHHRAPPGVHPEQFLVAVAAAYQRRHAPVPPAPVAPAGWAPSPPTTLPVVGGLPAPSRRPRATASASAAARRSTAAPPPPAAAPLPPPPPPAAPPPVPAGAARPVRTRPLTAMPEDEDDG